MSKILLGALVSVLLFTGMPNRTDGAQSVKDREITPLDIDGWKHFTDPLFEKIAFCESNNILDAKNPNSSAEGEYQFLIGTWKHYAPKAWGGEWVNKSRVTTDNRELAWYVYTRYGTSDWEADPKSYECWKSEIPNAKYKNII